jgi:hypothetical protein
MVETALQAATPPSTGHGAPFSGLSVENRASDRPAVATRLPRLHAIWCSYSLSPAQCRYSREDKKDRVKAESPQCLSVPKLQRIHKLEAEAPGCRRKPLIPNCLTEPDKGWNSRSLNSRYGKAVSKKHVVKSRQNGSRVFGRPGPLDSCLTYSCMSFQLRLRTGVSESSV